MRQTFETFKYFNNNDPGKYISWYKTNRRRLITRLLLVQVEGEYKRNTILFDKWLTSDYGIKQLHKKYHLSKNHVRTLINKQLAILNSVWAKEKGKQ